MQRRAELELLRESKAEASRQKAEEKRKAAEAAAATAKKGKGKAAAQAPADVKPEEAEDLNLDGDVHLEALPNSVDDDPARVREFLEFRKILREMNTGSATVGSILGAMVYQIGEMKEKKHQTALDADKPQSVRAAAKKGAAKRLAAKAEEANHKENEAQMQELTNLFDEVLEGLNIDYSIKETDFRHVFSTKKVIGDSTKLSSPYMSVKDENDKLLLEK